MQKTINILMVLFAFVFPISLGAANVILMLILLLWFTEGEWGRKYTLLKQTPIVWIPLFIGFLTLLSALLSPETTHSFLAGGDKNLYKVILTHYILLPFIVVVYMTSMQPVYHTYVLRAFLFSIFFSEMVSYLIFFDLIDISSLKMHHLLHQEASSSNPTPFLHHTEYSVLLSIAVILLLHQIFQAKNNLLKLFLLLFLISAASNLFVNGGRTGQIAILLGIMTYVIVYTKLHFKSLVSAVFILAVFVAGAYTLSPNFHHRANMAYDNIRQISQGNYTTSWGMRVASTVVTLDYLFSSPAHFVAGAGAGETRKVYLQHAQEHFPPNISDPIHILAHLHNQYLQYWMDGSILSLFLFLLLLFLLFRLPLPPSDKPPFYAFLVIFAFACATDIPMFRYQPAMLFYLMVAYHLYLSDKRYRL